MQPPSTPLRVGNGAGFWGDNLDAPYLLARDGRLDVLTLEYLAELTLAILSHLRSRDPKLGYVADFPDLLRRLPPTLIEQPHLKIVTNAGGLNPESCVRSCAEILSAAGLGLTPLAVVDGDDVLTQIPRWVHDGVDLANMETGRPITDVADRLVSANAYLGARPIARALDDSARIVVTGRVADASLTLGPAASHFGWSWDDWPRLAGASAAGHVIECGAQATGGLWHEWYLLDDWFNVGYPIAELFDDGSSIITKPENTGGLVSIGTVSEQIVYEIDDPTRYRTPDVDVDLTTLSLNQLSLNQDGPDRVSIRGTTGRAPSDFLKVAAVYRDGWAASGMLAVAGRQAVSKARAAGLQMLGRVHRAGFSLAGARVECLGNGEVVPGLLRPESEPLEVVLRVSVRDPDRAAVERFCREFAPLVTAGPPGIAGYTSARPSPRPAFGYWPTLIPKSFVESRPSVRSAAEWCTPFMNHHGSVPTVRLGDLAHARSGDKGDRANVGVVANDQSSYDHLREHLTAAAVAEYLSPLAPGEVRRYELPNILAFNFVIDAALGGGASRSLRLDTQGKALGVALLEMRVAAPGGKSEPPR